MDDFTHWAFLVFMLVVAGMLYKIGSFLEQIRDMLLERYTPTSTERWSHEED